MAPATSPSGPTLRGQRGGSHPSLNGLPVRNVSPAANEHDRAGQTGKSPVTSSGLRPQWNRLGVTGPGPAALPPGTVRMWVDRRSLRRVAVRVWTAGPCGPAAALTSPAAHARRCPRCDARLAQPDRRPGPSDHRRVKRSSGQAIARRTRLDGWREPSWCSEWITDRECPGREGHPSCRALSVRCACADALGSEHVQQG